MPSKHYKKLAATLLSSGWAFHRQGKGSHEIWHHEESGKKVTVPTSTKSQHTVDAVLKQAGLGKQLKQTKAKKAGAKKAGPEADAADPRAEAPSPPASSPPPAPRAPGRRP